MPPIGRPPLVRGVYSLDDALVPPDELVFDTSFVVDALIRTQPRHDACSFFLERVAETGSTVFFNGLLEAELWEAGFQIALKERHPKDWRRFRSDGRARRRARTLLRDLEASWARVLESLDWVRIELNEVDERVPAAMLECGISSYDAVHVATASYTGVRSVVTLDRHFALVPEASMDLYVHAAAVAACREQRRRGA